MVLVNATPRGLAVYAQQGAEHKARVDALLAEHDLMKQMLVAGGAKAGRYGQAMEILAGIRSSGGKEKHDILNRLAVATALELAARELSDYRDIDPVKRYLAYAKWYLAGELDPHFKGMTTWECRHIINDYSTEENLAWLRTMLRNYRPDTIATEFPRDKYMALTPTSPRRPRSTTKILLRSSRSSAMVVVVVPRPLSVGLPLAPSASRPGAHGSRPIPA